MDDKTRSSLLQMLGREMSDISEDRYYAGWLGGTEYFVPDTCRITRSRSRRNMPSPSIESRASDPKAPRAEVN